MLGKRVIKFEGSKLSQILCADKTGFRRLYHISVMMHLSIIYTINALVHEMLLHS